jgi:hypothetical protein
MPAQLLRLSHRVHSTSASPTHAQPYLGRRGDRQKFSVRFPLAHAGKSNQRIKKYLSLD